MEFLSIDFETRSTVDLRRTGVYPYAEDDSTSILCMAYAFGEGPVRVWTPEEPFPGLVWYWVLDGKPLRAHNAQFERVMWRDCLSRMVPGVPVPSLEQWHCTAAEAAAMALPRSLGKLSRVLNIPTPKDDAGHRLMLQMCKPRSVDEDGTVHWWDEESPEKVEKLLAYCKQDVRAERGVAKRLRRLSDVERKVYLLDQKINDRGVRLDVPLIEAAKHVVDRGTKEANAELRRLTDGEVTKVTQVAKLTGWLQEQGVPLDDIRKDTLRDVLEEEDLTREVERVIVLRQETGKSSTAKLGAMERARCSDDRARGLLLYHGASTGRWSGKLIQPQNFPRPGLKDAEQFIPDLLSGQYEALTEPPLEIVSSLLRGMLVASPGHRFLSGDFSQIEARMVGWLAGESYGDREYEKMAAAIFGVPVSDVTEEQRQVGKVAVLGCGYQMGWKRYMDTVKSWTGQTITEETARRAVDTYRRTKPGVPLLWSDVEGAAFRAVLKPGSVQHCGRDGCVRYVVRGPYLWCLLPSGRPLAYALPRIDAIETPWGMKDSVTYMGVDGYTRKWKRQSTYGGHLTENIVQAAARDVLAEAMLRVESAGYPVVLTVHDEIVSDVPDGHGSLDEFLEIMARTPEWARDCPINVEGWEGLRYRK